MTDTECDNCSREFNEQEWELVYSVTDSFSGEEKWSCPTEDCAGTIIKQL